MNEEKYKENSIGRWKCNSSNYVYCFSYSNRMWRFFFADLNKTCLKKKENKLIFFICRGVSVYIFMCAYFKINIIFLYNLLMKKDGCFIELYCCCCCLSQLCLYTYFIICAVFSMKICCSITLGI